MSDAALDDEPYVSTTDSPVSHRGVGYTVYDPMGQKVGSAEVVFVNWDQELEYVSVRIGLIDRRSVLIPVQFAEIDDERQIFVLK